MTGALFRVKIIHVNVEASVRICEIAAEGKYIFSSLKRDSLLLKCSAPDQNCFDNGVDSRHFAVFKHLELFSKVPKNLVNQENTC